MCVVHPDVWLFSALKWLLDNMGREMDPYITLEIRVEPRVVYSRALLKRLRCPIYIGNRVRYLNRVKLG